MLMVWGGFGCEGNSPGTGCTKVRTLMRETITPGVFEMCGSRRSFYLLRLRKKCAV